MAITYGMSVKEFWEDDPDLFWAYRFSYFEKIKTEQEMNVADVKARIAQVNAIRKNSATKKGTTEEVGEKING